MESWMVVCARTLQIANFLRIDTIYDLQFAQELEINCLRIAICARILSGMHYLGCA